MKKLTKLDILANQIETDLTGLQKDISMGVLDENGVESEIKRINGKIKGWAKEAKKVVASVQDKLTDLECDK